LQDTSRRIEDLVSPQYLRFKGGTPFAAIATGKTAVSAGQNQKAFAAAPSAASNFAQPALQQPIAKKVGTKIVHISQLVNRDAEIVVNLAAFTSACPVFVAV
jgi:hypothetical protein